MNNGKEQQQLERQKLRILFVEDSQEDTDLCVRALTRGGFDVEYDVVQTEQDFRLRVECTEYDVVLSDNALPRWSGVGALETLQELRPGIPVILVTGSIGEEAAVNIIKRGAFDYILKDRMMRLPDAIRRAVFHRRLQEEREHARRALQSSERRLRALIDHEPECVKLMDIEGRLLEINASGLRIVEADELATVLGKSIFPLIVPENREAFVELTQRAFQGEDGNLEFEAVGLKGTRRRLSTRVAPLDIEGRRVVLGITRDITNQRLMERKIHQLEKFEAIGQLAGGIAHDFNNILGAILGWAELGYEAAGEAATRDKFHKIQEQARRAAGLTRQLLAFARRQILEPRTINLNQSVTEVTSLLKNLIGERIELKLKLDPQISSTRADPSQIEQVMMNLCVNARDAMPDGGTLAISTADFTVDEDYQREHSDARPGRYVRITVADTGVGMDRNLIEHIFEPFFTTKGSAQGTGLGLPTVYGIVRQHNGFVNAYSELGHGSEFHVYLPAVEGEAEKVRADEPQSVRGGNETILVAEDHEGLRATAKATLEMLGYRLILARDGEEALRLFRTRHREIDLLLLDVVMPKLNGPEVFAHAQSIRASIPVVFSTGYGAESALLKNLIEQKAVAVLQKPYSLFTLGAKIREILDRKNDA